MKSQISYYGKNFNFKIIKLVMLNPNKMNCVLSFGMAKQNLENQNNEIVMSRSLFFI